MKFSLARAALVLAASLTLASCGGGGKATFPINVTVSNLVYPGFVLSSNGQDYAVTPNADPTQPVVFAFPNPIDYGQTYDVVPKGRVVAKDGSVTTAGMMPKHQTCATSPFPANGTAGQLAKIDVRYVCTINTFPLTGTVTGLTAAGLQLTNGSVGSISVAANATTFTMGVNVPYASTYGVSVLTQPTGLVCTVTGGNSPQNNGSGTIDDAAEAAGGVNNLAVTCVPSS